MPAWSFSPLYPMGTAHASAYRGRAMELRQHTARVAVFTSLEGTVLDSRTFDPGPSRAGIRRLLSANVPVIPVSVMTLEEIAPIARDLGLRDAMIVEAGGAIARWSNDEWEVEPCGPPAEALLDVVLEIERRSGANLLVYSALPENEAARLSGRTGEQLRASTRRSFSEPFVIESGDLESVKRAAASLGFAVRRGRRFLHLCRAGDEDEAFARVREEMLCELTIAAGSAAIDAGFLARADVPIIVPAPPGTPDRELLAAVPHARIAPAPGPEGWSMAIEEAWRTHASAPAGASIGVPNERTRTPAG